MNVTITFTKEQFLELLVKSPIVREWAYNTILPLQTENNELAILQHYADEMNKQFPDADRNKVPAIKWLRAAVRDEAHLKVFGKFGFSSYPSDVNTEGHSINNGCLTLVGAKQFVEKFCTPKPSV